MQRFEESNRVLKQLMAEVDENAAGMPTLALPAITSAFRITTAPRIRWMSVLDADPDGPFAADAEDFLDLIEDDDAMFEATGLKN
jgi:hypothetical protein